MKGNTRIWMVAAIGASIGVAIAAYRLTRDQGSMLTVSDDASHSARFAFRWPPGTQYTYSVDWDARSRARIGLGGQADMEPLEAALNLSADVVVRSLAQKDDRYVLGLSVAEIRQQSIRLVGQDPLPNKEAVAELFAGREVFVEVDERGVRHEMHFQSDDPTLFKEVMTGLASAMQVVLAPDGAESSWTVAERTTTGLAQATYTRDHDDLNRLFRIRPRYDEVLSISPALARSADQRLHSSAIIELDPAGHLRSLLEEEALTVTRAGAKDPELSSRSTFRMLLRDLGKTSERPPNLASLQTVAPGQPVPSPEAEQQIARQRGGKMTLKELTVGLEDYARLGTMPEERRWFAHAVGLLILRPELCAELVAAFQSSEMNQRGRLLIVDLLSAVGHREAQSALRKSLSTAAAREDRKAYARLLQGLGMVEKPDMESLAFLSREYDGAWPRGERPAKNASAYALGAALGRVWKDGDSAEIRRVNEKLRSDLAEARSAADQTAILAALGNAGLKENIALIREYAHDSESGVREQVATSLRKSDTEAAHETLLELVGDPDASVGASALQALMNHKLGAGDLDRLQTMVLGERTSRSLDPLIVSFLGYHLNDGEGATRILSFLSRRHTQDPALLARIRAVL